MPDTATILLIDDLEDKLEELDGYVTELARDQGLAVKTWKPVDGGDLESSLDHAVPNGTALVATDYDLTKAASGFFGSAVVAWCQRQYIPVINFSRKTPERLPKDAGLFEMRIPSQPAQAAVEIVRVAAGFRDLRASLAPDVGTDLPRSPADALADALDSSADRPELGAYFGRIGSASGTLTSRLLDAAGGQELRDGEALDLLTYLLGHVLYNSVLRYPGPILDDEALAAYCCTSVENEADYLAQEFSSASYKGPFSFQKRLFWRRAVDDLIDEWASAENFDAAMMAHGRYNRDAVENHAGRALSDHLKCDQRCHGTFGGYWCPFTRRPVCDRPDCAVASSTWIPQGAVLGRVERDYFEEWAPLLGY